MKNFVSWEVMAPITKAYQDEQGKMHVIAVASDDTVDLQRDQMTNKALDRMAAQAQEGVPLLDSHKSTFEFGRSIGGTVAKGKDGKLELIVDLELNGEYPQARTLFKEVMEGTCKRQLSIGGKLNLKNRDAISVEMTQKGLVRKIHDLELDHIACTRSKQAANPNTGFTEAVIKAMDDEDGAWDAFPENKSFEEDSTPVDSTSAVEKDVSRGAAILASLGKLFRKDRNGGSEMGYEEELTPVEDEVSEEGTVDETAQRVAEAVSDMVNGEEVVEDVGEEVVEEKMENDEEMSDEAMLEEAIEETEGEETPVDSGGYEEGEYAEGEMEGEMEDEMKMEVEEEGEGEYLEEGEYEEDEYDEMTPEETEAAELLMSKRRHRRDVEKKRKSESIKKSEGPSEDEQEMLREIAILLSKVQTTKGSITKGDAVQQNAIKGALWNIRYLVAKSLISKGTDVGGGVAALASTILGGELFAPTSESSAPKGQHNNSAQGDEVFGEAGSATSTNKVPLYSDAHAPTAPSVEDSKKMVLNALNAVKSKSRRRGTIEKTRRRKGTINKSMQEAVLEKSMAATGEMILKSVGKIVESQNEGMGKVEKALKSLAGRISAVESTTGRRQGGPRGVGDVEIQKSKRASEGGVWGGMFKSSASNATREM